MTNEKRYHVTINGQLYTSHDEIGEALSDYHSTVESVGGWFSKDAEHWVDIRLIDTQETPEWGGSIVARHVFRTE